MNDTNNQPVANGLPKSVPPVYRTPSSPATTGEPPTVTTASPDHPQHDQQSTEPRLAAAPATSDQAPASVQHTSTAAPCPTPVTGGSDPAPVHHAAPTLPGPALRSNDPVPTLPAIPHARGRSPLWAGMTPEERVAYAEGTKKRRSRKKARPSLDKHGDLIGIDLDKTAGYDKLFAGVFTRVGENARL